MKDSLEKRLFNLRRVTQDDRFLAFGMKVVLFAQNVLEDYTHNENENLMKDFWVISKEFSVLQKELIEEKDASFFAEIQSHRSILHKIKGILDIEDLRTSTKKNFLSRLNINIFR